jgi:hypothetical protein
MSLGSVLGDRFLFTDAAAPTFHPSPPNPPHIPYHILPLAQVKRLFLPLFHVHFPIKTPHFAAEFCLILNEDFPQQLPQFPVVYPSISCSDKSAWILRRFLPCLCCTIFCN